MTLLNRWIPKAVWLAAACLALQASTAFANDTASFPNRPITLYVGFAPGGAADTVARVVAEEMRKHLGQNVVVENKSGASGNLATQAILSAPADGYSVVFAAIHLATNPALRGVPYNPKSDLTMVSQITSVPVLMLSSVARPVNSPQDAVELARKEPGGLKVGSGGIGTSSHLAMELFSRSRNVPFIHVPYRGGAPANLALMSGEIDLMFDLMSGSLKSMVDSGKVRPIAVMQDSRLQAMPDVKSAKELGLPEDTFIRSWQGLAVRSGTPASIVTRLHAAVVASAQSPAVRQRIEQLGSEVVISKSPADFQAHYERELDRWSSLIKAANIKAE
jgi:tripartite-type tricarboxylate transporter receptor subunit TctC